MTAISGNLIAGDSSTCTAQPNARFSSPPQIDRRALEKSPEDVTVTLMRDRVFRNGVRSWLRTQEQRQYFDFITDMSVEFMVGNAGVRLTHERIAQHLGIPQDRIPSLHKTLKRAFQRQLKLMSIKDGV